MQRGELFSHYLKKILEKFRKIDDDIKYFENKKIFNPVIDVYIFAEVVVVVEK